MHNYFVYFKIYYKDGNTGNGNCCIDREFPISCYEDINGIQKSILDVNNKSNSISKVLISNFIKLEAVENNSKLDKLDLVESSIFF